MRRTQSIWRIILILLAMLMGGWAPTRPVGREAALTLTASGLPLSLPESDQSGEQTRLAASGRKGHSSADAPVEVKCAVVAWNVAPPKPVLTLVCPPEEVFAPLRVYFKLSWAASGDIPSNYLNILAAPKALTKLHWTRTELHVWLPIKGEGGGKVETKWVIFTEVVGFYLGASDNGVQNYSRIAPPE